MDVLEIGVEAGLLDVQKSLEGIPEIVLAGEVGGAVASVALLVSRDHPGHRAVRVVRIVIPVRTVNGKPVARPNTT